MQIRTIHFGVVDEVIEKNAVAVKQSGVFSKQAKKQAHQIGFQVFPRLAGGFDDIVQTAHFFGGALVDGGLLPDGDGFITGNKFEVVYRLRKIGQFDFKRRLFAFQVIQVQVGKIADQHATRHFLVLESGKIFRGLDVGFIQVCAGRFHLNQQQAGKKAIYPPALAAQFFHPFFKTDGAAVVQVEDMT